MFNSKASSEIDRRNSSPVLTDEIRKDLFEKTVKMVEQINYEGAGTVEFIYENGKFYFLEMNTRVQVEHPVTKCKLE